VSEAFGLKTEDTIGPLSPEQLKLEQSRIRMSALVAGVVVAAAIAMAYFALRHLAVWPEERSDRLALGVQCAIPLALVLIVAVQRVSSGRYRSAADNRGAAFSPPSHLIAIDAAFLQNTIEQVFITVIGLLAWASVAPVDLLVLVPTASILFVVGRIAFRIGYPHGAGARAFGMALTAIPGLLACVGASVFSLMRLF
jgi:hypothetical protein